MYLCIQGTYASNIPMKICTYAEVPIHYAHPHSTKTFLQQSSGCGSVACNTRDLQFESRHWPILLNYQKYSFCDEKTKIDIKWQYKNNSQFSQVIKQLGCLIKLPNSQTFLVISCIPILSFEPLFCWIPFYFWTELLVKNVRIRSHWWRRERAASCHDLMIISFLRRGSVYASKNGVGRRFRVLDAETTLPIELVWLTFWLALMPFWW